MLAVGAFRDDAQRIRAAQRSVDCGGRLDGDVCQNGKLDTAAVIAVQRQRELDCLRIVPDPPSVALLVRTIGSKAVRFAVHSYRIFRQRPARADICFHCVFRDIKTCARRQLLCDVAAVREPDAASPIRERQSVLGLRRRERDRSAGLCKRLVRLIVCTILDRDRDTAHRQPDRIELCAAGKISIIPGHVAVRFPFWIRRIIVDVRPIACSVLREIIGASCDNPSAA